MKRFVMLAAVVAATTPLTAGARAPSIPHVLAGAGVAPSHFNSSGSVTLAVEALATPAGAGSVLVCTVSNCTGNEPFPRISLSCSTVKVAADQTFSWYASGHSTLLADSPKSRFYLFRVIEAGQGRIDRLGIKVAERLPRDGKCGAATVATSPLTAGDFRLVGSPGVPASPDPHGCVSFANNVSLNLDFARRSLVARVNTNSPCTFYFSAGDTFSGSGEYKISCATGGVVTDSLAQGPQYQVPIPQPCDVGAIVTVQAGHAGSGGTVVAGSPT